MFPVNEVFSRIVRPLSIPFPHLHIPLPPWHSLFCFFFRLSNNLVLRFQRSLAVSLCSANNIPTKIKAAPKEVLYVQRDDIVLP